MAWEKSGGGREGKKVSTQDNFGSTPLSHCAISILNIMAVSTALTMTMIVTTTTAHALVMSFVRQLLRLCMT